MCALEYESVLSGPGFRSVQKIERIQKTAKAVAHLDAIRIPCTWLRNAITMCARRSNEKGIIDIKNGRHPVVESMIHERYVYRK